MEAKRSQYHPVLLPLFGLSALSIWLYVFRLIGVGDDRFWFMNWNLVLAWVPLLLAWQFSSGLPHRRWTSKVSVALIVLWVLFLPNSFYMVSDFIHIRNSSDADVIYDVIMLSSYALTGMVLGWVSTLIMHNHFSKKFGAARAWQVILAIFVACGFAIYLGRYLGWNSWDVIFSPAFILFDVSERVLNPTLYPDMFMTVFLFSLFIAASYAAFRLLLVSGKRVL